MSISDLIAAASLVVAAAALGISIYAIARANKTTSAATLVTLNEGFRQAFERYLGSPSLENLAELLNLLEIACAIYLERSVAGNSRILLGEYIKSVVSILAGNQIVGGQAASLLQSRNTFAFVKRFIKEKPAALSVTIPPAWYQLDH